MTKTQVGGAADTEDVRSVRIGSGKMPDNQDLQGAESENGYRDKARPGGLHGAPAAGDQGGGRLGAGGLHGAPADDSDEIREECGVFGIYDFDGGDVASTIYYGLLALQHRGQESCGIAVSDTDAPKAKVKSSREMGLVNEAFTPEVLEKLQGDIGVGHVRYSTAGSSTRENAQPLVLNYVKGTLALAHNGNLINAPKLRRELEYTGAIFQTTIDSEVIAYHIARERLNTRTVQEAVGRAMDKIQGAYSLVIMSPRKLIGARDPFGFRPLCIGQRGNAYLLASESCVLDTVGAKFLRDVYPGEIVTISPEQGMVSDMSHALPSGRSAGCVFEYIYFARPDSRLDGVSVYDSRILAGKFLALDSPVEADLVVGVPESGNCSALGYSLQSGIPYGTAFVKNAYVGRTFIKPGQRNRESSVQVKLNVIREAVDGKRIIMIDDSIVRGTTSDRIVHMLREAGAKEVHMRVSSPPFLWPCYFGTDVPAREQLIAYQHTIPQISRMIGTDSLDYLKLERLGEIVRGLGICKGCFDGQYPMEPPKEDIRGEFES
ncbi:MAG: amidophosphoribosyltransferase [Clostridium sp.]|jgi:amidophosphoribosyltransferase|nr:amidophosphoribosyltransferase [Clostridium sp.]